MRLVISAVSISVVIAVIVLLIIIANNPNLLWNNKNRETSYCGNPTLLLNSFIRDCEDLLAKGDIISYCKQREIIDINEDGNFSTVQYKGHNICELSIFCWSVTPYDEWNDIKNVTGDECAVELCKYYIYSKNLSPEEATLKVFGYYNMEKSEILSIGDQETFKDRMLEFNNYKNIKEEELGYIFFISKKCTTDDAIVMAYKEIGNRVFPLLDQNKIEYKLGIAWYNNSSYGYLYIDKSSIRKDLLYKISLLYKNDTNSIPDRVPLCALLALLSS